MAICSCSTPLPRAPYILVFAIPGRVADDPTSTLPQGEMVLMEGSGSQTGTSRWGDYATIALDPLDDCTFWFAGEYVPANPTPLLGNQHCGGALCGLCAKCNPNAGTDL